MQTPDGQPPVGPDPSLVEVRESTVSNELRAAAAARALSFYTYPADRSEFSVRAHRNMRIDAEWDAIRAKLAPTDTALRDDLQSWLRAVVPLLEDALMDRDMVHRQTACTTVKHMALGSIGLGCEDAMQHLLNLVWPNIFETSPHVINSVMEAIEGMRCVLGPTKVLQYTLQGLFHPARKVREVYWKIYNNLYIGSQAALVPAYPRIENDATNRYQHTELELFL